MVHLISAEQKCLCVRVEDVSSPVCKKGNKHIWMDVDGTRPPGDGAGLDLDIDDDLK